MPQNLNGWPSPFRALNEPLRTLIGRYEAGLSKERKTSKYAVKTFAEMCESVEAFFYDHPKIKRPEQILITDVEDWRQAMLLKFQPNTVRKALGHLKAFYSWLRKESGYVPKTEGALREVLDPVVIPPYHPPTLA